MRFAVLALALTILAQSATIAQEVAPQKVDQVFSVYDKAASPGCNKVTLAYDSK